MNLPLNLQTDELMLPAPRLAAAGSLQTALAQRRSTRNFLADPLSIDELSALLWAAVGVNRTGPQRRTAPSAHNWQEIDVYAVLPEATWRYAAATHRLALVKTGDLRALT
ncbi:MAG TPA: nitroreductase family protein, partial [Ramlibacter sp.]